MNAVQLGHSPYLVRFELICHVDAIVSYITIGQLYIFLVRSTSFPPGNMFKTMLNEDIVNFSFFQTS